MKMKNHVKKGTIVGIAAVVLIYLFMVFVGWITTCGLYLALCLCFGWEFSWGIGTGLWICWYILKSIFNVTVKSKD